MPIISSVITEDNRQIDGRRWICERHTNSTGSVREIRYMAGALTVVTTIMAARVAQLDAETVQAEVNTNVAGILANGRTFVPTFLVSTLAANAAAMREAYRNATRLDAIMLGDYLGSLTTPQLQTAFGMTSGQVGTLRTARLNAAATNATAIRASVGQ